MPAARFFRAQLRWLTPDSLAFLSAAAMLGASVLGPWLGEPAAFRNSNIVIAGLALLGWLNEPERWRRRLSPAAFAMVSLSALVWFEAASFSAFRAQHIHGFDFSVFDWQLASTARGRFGYSPIYELNHFGVHSSFLMLALVPLYWVAESPVWLLFMGPLVLWSAVFPLRRLTLHTVGEHGGLLLAVVLAYWANPATGRVLQEGFRIENALPVLTAWLIIAWLERRYIVFFGAVAGLLCTKEDAALWVSTFALASAFIERRDARRVLAAAGAVMLSAVWLFTYARVLQPMWVGHQPEYLHFWSDFGAAPREIVSGMLRHPGLVLTKLLTSGFWVFFGPLLFLPFTSLRATAGVLPTVFLLGVSNYEPMRSYSLYYAVPLVAFALFGVLEFAAAAPAATWPRQVIAFAALLAFPLFRGGYAHVIADDPQRLAGASQVREVIAQAPLVFGQAAIFPYLGYPQELRDFYRLSDVGTPGALFVVNPGVSVEPFSADELTDLLAKARAEGRARELQGGFVVIRAETR